MAVFFSSFIYKNEAKKRRCSQIALLSRVFTATGFFNIAWLSPDALFRF